jgi:hypothetical protein
MSERKHRSTVGGVAGRNVNIIGNNSPTNVSRNGGVVGEVGVEKASGGIEKVGKELIKKSWVGRFNEPQFATVDKKRVFRHCFLDELGKYKPTQRCRNFEVNNVADILLKLSPLIGFALEARGMAPDVEGIGEDTTGFDLGKSRDAGATFGVGISMVLDALGDGVSVFIETVVVDGEEVSIKVEMSSNE